MGLTCQVLLQNVAIKIGLSAGAMINIGQASNPIVLESAR